MPFSRVPATVQIDERAPGGDFEAEAAQGEPQGVPVISTESLTKAAR
jgi:hypothetical protein